MGFGRAEEERDSWREKDGWTIILRNIRGHEGRKSLGWNRKK